MELIEKRLHLSGGFIDRGSMSLKNKNMTERGGMVATENIFEMTSCVYNFAIHI